MQKNSLKNYFTPILFQDIIKIFVLLRNQLSVTKNGRLSWALFKIKNLTKLC